MEDCGNEKCGAYNKEEDCNCQNPFIVETDDCSVYLTTKKDALADVPYNVGSSCADILENIADVLKNIVDEIYEEPDLRVEISNDKLKNIYDEIKRMYEHAIT